MVSFDRARREFSVAWDDGDESGTVQPYRLVCRNAVPPGDAIGVGSTVLFAQATYYFIDRHGTRHEGLDRYHEGVVTAIERDGATGERLYVGRHAKGAADGKRVSYKGYAETFRLPLAKLRVPGNLLEAVAGGAHVPQVLSQRI